MREGKGMIKILIVEDEISISKMMEMSLKRSDINAIVHMMAKKLWRKSAEINMI